jgi:serine/tyrosine/threonine adenylyltransferase
LEAYSKEYGGKLGFNFDNSFSRSLEGMYEPTTAQKFNDPSMVILNEQLGSELGLEVEQLRQEGHLILSGQRNIPGSFPIAMAYAGHQFGHLSILGDGRAVLLGEHIDPSGQRYDIQLKGAGKTRFSRSGDGLAALGPMIREYLFSEALFYLGVPTTRSLAVIKTGETIYRSHPNLGSVLTRVASSHLRVGTFQYAAYTESGKYLKPLADYTIRRHFPDIELVENKYLGLLNQVIERQALLVAKWMNLGFIHGVLNTDNVSICGETIDYGPCAFMNRYNPDTVFSSIDEQGRYAYRNQPFLTEWNLTRFAETLIPLLDNSRDRAIAMAEEALSQFQGFFMSHWLDGMRKKLGLLDSQDEDLKLAEDWLMLLYKHQADFTNSFRNLSSEILAPSSMLDDLDFNHWMNRWKSRVMKADWGASVKMMNQVNPAIIPRNHLVEEVILQVENQADLNPLNQILQRLSKPYEDVEVAGYKTPPPPTYDSSYQTYCGT